MITETTMPVTGAMSSVAGNIAGNIVLQSKPQSHLVHVLKSGKSTQLFIPNGSRLYKIEEHIEKKMLSLIMLKDEQGIEDELIRLGLEAPAYIDNTALQNPPLYALSLAIAQKCNMGCSYCYAGQGSFGGPTKNMSLDTAFKSIDLLLKDCPAGGKAQLSFMGGEPLVNRTAIVVATKYAQEQAMKKNIQLGFSITTNGTLLTGQDALFFEEYGFAVTVSLDGIGTQHDIQRPMKNGKGSYDTIIKNIQPLLALQKKCRYLQE